MPPKELKTTGELYMEDPNSGEMKRIGPVINIELGKYTVNTDSGDENSE